VEIIRVLGVKVKSCVSLRGYCAIRSISLKTTQKDC
jgi:hypothetical protein